MVTLNYVGKRKVTKHFLDNPIGKVMREYQDGKRVLSHERKPKGWTTELRKRKTK